MRKTLQKYKAALWQFVRFNIVGILNTIIDWGFFAIFNQVLLVSYLPAKIISYSCGLINSYICNALWTFRAKKNRNLKQIFLFIGVNLVALGVSLLVLYVCNEFFNMKNNFISNLIATPFSIVINFLGNKMLVFPKNDESMN